MDNTDDNKANLPFSLRYGYEQLPELMKIETLSPDLRKDIWESVEKMLDGLIRHIDNNILTFMNDETLQEIRDESRNTEDEDYYFREYYFVEFMNGILRILIRRSRLDLPDTSNQVKALVETIISKGEFYLVLNLLEYLLNTDMVISAEHVFKKTAEQVSDDFKFYNAAYCLEIEDGLYKFFPAAPLVKNDDVLNAINTMHENNMAGALTHYDNARVYINEGRYNDSIKESIHMVESVARNIRPDLKNQGLGQIISNLSQSKFFKHPALAKAFKQFYGYTSDEPG